jgi:hypothetical protein
MNDEISRQKDGYTFPFRKHSTLINLFCKIICLWNEFQGTCLSKYIMKDKISWIHFYKEEKEKQIQGFQYFSLVPVLHSLQVVLFLLKIWTLFMNILYNTLKWGGTNDHFRQVKLPGTIPYWKVCKYLL